MEQTLRASLSCALSVWEAFSYFRRWRKKAGCVWLAVPLVLALFVVDAKAAQPMPSALTPALNGPRNVVILFSYHRALWSDNVLRGIEAVFSQHPDVNFSCEYMDTKHLSTPEYFQILRKIYIEKYAPTQVDLVICVDNDALNLVVKNRDALFRNVPIVFCGVNDYTPALHASRPGVTGVSESGDFSDTLRFITHVRPQAKKILVVCDHTATGRTNTREFLAALPDVAPGMEPVLLDKLSFAELATTLRNAPFDTVAFFISFWKDSQGHDIPVQQLGAAFKQSAVPVFGRSEWMIGHGMVGGKCVTGITQGEAAGRLALRVLNGEPISSLAVITDSPNRFLFDDQMLRKFRIPASTLPAGSIVFNRPESFVRVSYSSGLLAIFFSSLLCCGILLLILNDRKRRLTLRALRDSEENLRITLNSIGDAVIATDKNECVTWLNPVAEQLTGWDATSAVGLPLDRIFVIVSAVTRNPVENPAKAVMQTGQIVALANHTVLISRSGEECHISDSGSPIRDAAGNLRGVVLVFRDVTEQHAMAEQLQHAQRLDSVGQLAGGIAHDFNNMLAGIMGAAEMLEHHSGADPKLQPLVRLIVDAAARSSELTQKLLAFSRKGKFQAAPLDLHAVIRDAVELLRRSVDQNVNFELRLEARYPVLSGDASQLENMIINLGLNARDAMPEGGTFTIITENRSLDIQECRQETIANKPGAYIIIDVCDTGVGIPLELQDKLFDPFFTTKDIGKGAGLGLAAVYGTIREHCGSIKVISESGKGTTFRIFLPVDPAARLALKQEPSPTMTGNGCILVVDDEEIVRNIVREVLVQLGYEVILASDGIEAEEVFRQSTRRIDLVLLDMVMPRRSGKDTFYALREIDPHVRVIIASGYSRDGAVSDLLAEGVNDFLQKPFLRSQLAATVSRAMNSV